MIIYNITIQLQWAIHDDWLWWMKQEHIPEVINTGCFVQAQLLRLLEIEEVDGPTYAIQFITNEKPLYDAYISTHAARLRQKSFDKWGNQFIAFRTLMQAV